MSAHQTTPPESSRQGAARERMENDINRRPTLPAEIGANRTERADQSRSTLKPTPHERKQGNSTLFKHFRISHLNCRKSRLAIDELIKIRPRDDILFISELPLKDGQPPNPARYTPIHHEDKPTVCAYIKDASLKYMVKHDTHPHFVRIHLTDDRTAGGIYIPPGNDLPEYAQTPMKIGEIRLGDYNAAHPDYLDTDPPTARGTSLAAWHKTQECEERGPDYPTHEYGRKLDLIFCKNTIDKPTKIMHNGTVEHSDHTCQSIMLPLRIKTNDKRAPRTNYKKVDTAELKDRIEKMNLTKPLDANDLINQLEEIKSTLPTRITSDRPRIIQPVIKARRDLNKARKKKAPANEIKELRLKYRQSMRDFNNNEIEETLEQANQNERFFRLNKRGITKKAVPTMIDDDGTKHQSHDKISTKLAEHHGSGPPTDNDTIQPAPHVPRISHHEVTESLNKAPPHSTLGLDDIGIPLLKAYHAVHPINDILTDILTRGIHSDDWKRAVVVPIPKANKPNYFKPKSWRSIHLLSLISKTLERIVLARLQDTTTCHNTLGPTQFGS